MLLLAEAEVAVDWDCAAAEGGCWYSHSGLWLPRITSFFLQNVGGGLKNILVSKKYLR